MKRYLIVLSVFTLGNSADAFLLLRLTDAAGGPQFIPALWSLHHVVKMVSSAIGGGASDRFGRRPLIAGGWTLYAAVYAGFALSTSLSALVTWFMIYGIYYGCVGGSERALVADFAPAELKGTAFGVYNAVAGVGALISSVVFGLIWSTFSAPIAFWFRCGARDSRRGAAVHPRSRSTPYTTHTTAIIERMIRILVTNDDGVRSDGLKALADALRPLGEITVVAPLAEASAIGHALTLRRPLRLERFPGGMLRRGRHAHRLRQHRHHHRAEGHARPDRLGYQQRMEPWGRCHLFRNRVWRVRGRAPWRPSIAVSLQYSGDLTFDFAEAARAAHLVGQSVLEKGLPGRGRS